VGGAAVTDIEEFAAFYAANVSALTMSLYAYTGDLGAAQDAVQEAFTRALVRWDRIAQHDNPVAWTRRVAWNLATSRWRRLRVADRHLRAQRDVSVPGPEPDQVALIAALKTLPDKQRRAIVMHYLGGLTAREIGLVEGQSEANVRVLLHRGRAALAALLAEASEVRHG
jgi:RNA polymerase sigma-70 factor (ECF subfamily)